jgi:hyperosmotically inducible protein
MTYKIITAAAMAILTVSTVSLRGTRPVYATDNSEENAVLAKASARTAQDQPNDRADCLTAARVRRAIMADDSLSIYAQNVKIIVAKGRVTLEGPVCSDDERQSILFDVATVVAQSTIDNKLTIG